MVISFDRLVLWYLYELLIVFFISNLAIKFDCGYALVARGFIRLFDFGIWDGFWYGMWWAHSALHVHTGQTDALNIYFRNITHDKIFVTAVFKRFNVWCVKELKTLCLRAKHIGNSHCLESLLFPLYFLPTFSTLSYLLSFILISAKHIISV